MADCHMCGAGAWVQAPNPRGPSSLLGWHLERLHLVSIHHLTASATLRVEPESFHSTVHYAVWTPKCHAIGVRLSHILQATH